MASLSAVLAGDTCPILASAINVPRPTFSVQQGYRTGTRPGQHEDTVARIGYARVSTKNQNDDSQVDELNAHGVDKLFVDQRVSGEHASRPHLDALPSALAFSTSPSTQGRWYPS